VIVTNSAFALERINFSHFIDNFSFLGKYSFIFVKSLVVLVKFVHFSQHFGPFVSQSFLILRLTDFLSNFKHSLSVEPQPIVKSISFADCLLIHKIHKQQTKTTQVL